MNTMNPDWVDRQAYCLVCDHCKFIHWFQPTEVRPSGVRRTGLGFSAVAVADGPNRMCVPRAPVGRSP